MNMLLLVSMKLFNVHVRSSIVSLRLYANFFLTCGILDFIKDSKFHINLIQNRVRKIGKKLLHLIITRTVGKDGIVRLLAYIVEMFAISQSLFRCFEFQFFKIKKKIIENIVSNTSPIMRKFKFNLTSIQLCHFEKSLIKVCSYFSFFS